MSQPINTPGPVRVFSPLGRPEIVTDRPTAHETQSVVTQFGQPNADSNARLLAAAYNAFDSAAKKLGINAVECAERMADGGIAELFEALDYLLAQTVDMDLKHGITLTEGEEDAKVKALGAIAKVKGGA